MRRIIVGTVLAGVLVVSGAAACTGSGGRSGGEGTVGDTATGAVPTQAAKAVSDFLSQNPTTVRAALEAVFVSVMVGASSIASTRWDELPVVEACK